MAAWFVEIRCRELMTDSWDGWHTTDNEFLTARERENQMVVDIDTILSQQQAQPWDGGMAGWDRLS
jgi:hypothetical protein